MRTMIGYKATDADMRCRGVEFRIDEWSEPIKGKLVECSNGYHFCEHFNGVFDHYFESGMRVFKVECRDVLPKRSHGEKTKRCCRSLRLIEETEINEQLRLAMKDLGI